MGIPIWTFKLLRKMLDVASVDFYVMSPLLLLGVALFLYGIIVHKTSGIKALFILLGLGCCLAFYLLLKWADSYPSIPDETDIDFVSISKGVKHFPKAPPAPLSSDLVAKGSSWFHDKQGRKVLLRGVNLGGSSKVPTRPHGASYNKDHFFEWENVTFKGRPFPLSEADIHLGRLRCWGFTCIRLILTWEAIEHEGPGKYDLDYLEYLLDIIRKCREHGISVFLDAHQDVWSRWTGGDGAPAWTLEKVGFELENLDASGAAVTHQMHGDPFPKMVWNSNNSRLAAGTMWTLFFAGNVFAPKTKIDGVPVQEYLQGHFARALEKVAEMVKFEPNVLGFDILNEPSVGFVGFKDMRDLSPNQFYIGWRVDPWTAIQLGAGMCKTVDYFSSFMMYDGTRELNTTNTYAWQGGPHTCVWHVNGVWDYDPETSLPRLLKPDYFSKNPQTGKPVDFLNDHAIPFWMRCSQIIRKHMPNAVIFAEPVLDMTKPNHADYPKLSDEQVGNGFVWAKHWYDGITLMTKHFSKYVTIETISHMPVIGLGNIERAHGRGLSSFRKEAAGMGTGGSPVLVGEVGIPFDMDEKKPFISGDFSECTMALNTSMRSLEHAMLSFTLWNYTSDNTNERGDLWNDEDLSLFSQDQVGDDADNLHAGGRSLAAAIRPYPCRTAGDPLHFSFDPYHRKRRFHFKYQANHTLVTRETVIFLPKYHYPNGVDVTVHGKGEYSIDWKAQTLTYLHDPSCKIHEIVVEKVISSQPTLAQVTVVDDSSSNSSDSMPGLELSNKKPSMDTSLASPEQQDRANSSRSF